MIFAYFKTCLSSPMDWFILGSGIVLTVFHFRYIFGEKYQFKQLEIRRDRLLYFCEFFPLLGLTGTMLGLMGTFSTMNPNDPDLAKVVQQFSPALSTTISGLLCLMINLFWNFLLSWRMSK